MNYFQQLNATSFIYQTDFNSQFKIVHIKCFRDFIHVLGDHIPMLSGIKNISSISHYSDFLIKTRDYILHHIIQKVFQQ